MYIVGVFYKNDEKDQPKPDSPNTKIQFVVAIISKKTHYTLYIIMRNNPKFPIGLVPFFYAVI